MYIARRPETKKRKEAQWVLPQDTKVKVLKNKPFNEITDVNPAPPTAQMQNIAAKPVKNQNLPSYLTEAWSMDELKRSEESALQHQGMKKQASQRAKERYERFANSMTNVDNIDFMERKPGDAERLEQEAKRLWDDWKRQEKEAEKANQDLWSIQARIQKLEKNPRMAAYYATGTAELDARIAEAMAVETRAAQQRTELSNAYNAIINEPGAQMGELTYEKEAEAQALLMEMQKYNNIYNNAYNERRVMEDVYNERKYAQVISEMDATDFFLLEMTGMTAGARIRYMNAATPELRTELREKGGINLAMVNPKKLLKERGYSNEEIKKICDTYDRIINATDMYELQVQAAEKAAERPIGTTFSTYPAKLVGDASGDITALASNIGSDLGLSTYSTMDVNHPGFRLSEYVDTTRDTVSSNLSGAAKVAYQVGNDTVDSLLTDEAGKLLGMPWLAVSGAYGEKARKAIMYGGTSEQSNLLGTAKLTEAAVKDAVNNLTNQPETWHGKVFQAGMQATIDQTFKQARQIALNNHPEYVRRVEELMRNGMDRSRAREQALYQMMLERNG